MGVFLLHPKQKELEGISPAAPWAMRSWDQDAPVAGGRAGIFPLNVISPVGDLGFLESSCDIWQGDDGLGSPESLALEGHPLAAESMDLGTGLAPLQLNPVAYPPWPLHGCGGEDGGDLPKGAMGWKMPKGRASSRVSLLLVQERSLLLAQLWQMEGVWHLWMPWPQLWNPPMDKGRLEARPLAGC